MGAISTARAVVTAFIARHSATGTTTKRDCQAAVPLVNVTEPPGRSGDLNARTALSAAREPSLKEASYHFGHQIGHPGALE
jgi:hypothetical protein